MKVKNKTWQPSLNPVTNDNLYSPLTSKIGRQ